MVDLLLGQYPLQDILDVLAVEILNECIQEHEQYVLVMVLLASRFKVHGDFKKALDKRKTNLKLKTKIFGSY